MRALIALMTGIGIGSALATLLIVIGQFALQAWLSPLYILVAALLATLSGSAFTGIIPIVEEAKRLERLREALRRVTNSPGAVSQEDYSG